MHQLSFRNLEFSPKVTRRSRLEFPLTIPLAPLVSLHSAKRTLRGKPFQKANPYAWKRGQSGNAEGRPKYRTGTVKLTARRNIKDKEADSPSLVGHPIVFLKLLRERSHLSPGGKS